jgi:hypothetical protein
MTAKPQGRPFAVVIGVFLLLSGAGAGAFAMLRSSAGAPRLAPAGSKGRPAAVAYCGLVACSMLRSSPADRVAKSGRPAGSRPSGATAAGVPPSAPARAAAPAPTSSPAAVPNPVPTATAAPARRGAGVTVTYSTAQRWDGGFQGELTIVNHTSSTVSGWQIVVTLPDDQVSTVWNASWHPGSQGGVIMTAAAYDQDIEPHAAQSVNFIATGAAAAPTACTFDGSACQADPGGARHRPRPMWQLGGRGTGAAAGHRSGAGSWSWPDGHQRRAPHWRGGSGTRWWP